ncbi:hypothetical protein B1A98_13195 [Bacillus badius]|nr:hypothetical protein A6M11_12675 [Bacillus badius]OVE51339.1 hypothetical protein B1A98_13195 [Bacillus badius]
MENFSSYLKYKDSGYICFGNIPEHWKVLRNGRIFFQRNQTGFPDLPILEVSLKTGVRVRNFEDSKRKQVLSDREKYKRVAKGDIAYNMMRMWQGAVGVAPVDGLVSPAYVVASPLLEVDSRYYSYLFRTQIYMDEVNKYSHGIVADRNRLYWDEFKQIPSLIPPLEEQNQIVKYLDFQLAMISKFIKAKKNLIIKLKEKKQVVINEAVTKGINPNVKMKSSRINWVGDIPEHWEVTRNKNLLGLRKETVGDKHHEYTLLSLTTNGIISRDMENGKGKFPTDFSSYQTVRINDIVFCLFDIDETPRTVGLSDLHGMITGAYNVFKIKNINREYLYYYYLSLDQRKALKPLYTGLRKVITTDVFLRAKVPQPPIEEQINIVNYIKENISIIDNIISTTQRQIELIEEYRNRLISDVVTGKIDVRDIQFKGILEDVEIDDNDEEDLIDDREVVDSEECEV